MSEHQAPSGGTTPGGPYPPAPANWPDSAPEAAWQRPAPGPVPPPPTPTGAPHAPQHGLTQPSAHPSDAMGTQPVVTRYPGYSGPPPAASAPPAPTYHPATAQYPAQPPWTPAGAVAVEDRPERSGSGKGALGVALATLLAFGAGVGGVFVGYQLKDEPAPVQQIINAAPSIDESKLSEIAAALMPTVVVISTQSGEGSGVIMSADGYIITNNHVVQGAQNDTVTVAFNTGKKVQGDIVGTDPQTDIAVVKAKGVADLKFATFGDSNAVQVGDRVLAIGSPLGLQGSVTSGIVSALHRTIAVGGEGGIARTTLGDAIQTDAPINPGNSGGALVSTKGEVIGINTAIVGSGSSEGQGGNIGLGFAISSNRATNVANQLIKGGSVSHPYLGVQATDAETGGAQLQRVEDGSPAAKAGLKDGDIVTKINGKDISGSEDLVAAVQSGKVGEKLTIVVSTDGNERTVTATLAEKP